MYIHRFKKVFYRTYEDGKVRYVLVGIVTGNINLRNCGEGLPDIYNFIGNRKVYNTILYIINKGGHCSEVWCLLAPTGARGVM